MSATPNNDLLPTGTVKLAKKAISHVLQQIRENPTVGWRLGHGTESFRLLTEAAAALFDKPVEEIRENFAPENPRDPSKVEVDAAGQIYADHVKPGGRSWDDMDEWYRSEAAREEENLLEAYGLGVTVKEEEGE